MFTEIFTQLASLGSQVDKMSSRLEDRLERIERGAGISSGYSNTRRRSSISGVRGRRSRGSVGGIEEEDETRLESLHSGEVYDEEFQVGEENSSMWFVAPLLNTAH